MPRLLITGATGFLGQSVVAAARQQGWEVRTTGRSASLSQPLPDYRPCDLATADNLAPLVDGVEGIVHCAGLAHQFAPQDDGPTRFEQANVVATVRLADAAQQAGVRRFVQVSSVSVYGRQPRRRPGQLIDEQAALSPQGHYAHSKLRAEQQLLDLCGKGPLELVVLRLATLYGPHDPGNVGRLIRAIERGRFVWIGDGSNLKSLIDRDDAAAACLLAATWGRRFAKPAVYNVVGQTCPMHDVVHHIAAALGRTPPRVQVPAALASKLLALLATLPLIKSRARRWHNTISKWLADDAYDGRQVARQLGFCPRVALADGLARQVAWMQGGDAAVAALAAQTDRPAGQQRDRQSHQSA